MKILKWLVGIVVVLVASVYVLAFTSFGNGIVAPIIEKKIQEASQTDVQLKTFVLDLSTIEVNLALDDQNSVEVNGSYSLFSQSFDLSYLVQLKNLEALQKLAQRAIKGSFVTQGKVVGDMKLLNVDGTSDLAHSETTYHVTLEDLNPTSIIAKIDGAQLASLLYMIGEKQYASATINLDLNMKNIKEHQLDGDVTLLTSKGELNSQVMQKNFNINIPPTTFSMKLDTKLQGDTIKYKYALDSNLAHITSKGDVNPQPLELDVELGLHVQELAVLKPMIQADLRGALNLNATAKGSQEKLSVKGFSDIASSATTFEALLKNFEPKSFHGSVKHLQIAKLLYMIKQPHYLDATLDVQADLDSLDPKNLSGKVETYITNGLLDSKYLTKQYEFKSPMPKTTLSGAILTKLAGTTVDTKMDLKTSLATLNIKKALYDIEKSSLNSDYSVAVADLDKLYFVTQQHLKGKIKADGIVQKAKDLDLTLVSNVAGGKLDAKLHNDDFVADIVNMKTLDILDMLIYPKVFASDINGKLNYNLASASGKFDTKLTNGMFTQNAVLDLTKTYAKIDLYKQKFLGNLNGTINKDDLLVLLDLKSNTSSIYTKDTKLNTKTQQIDSKIKIVANNNPPLYVTLQGELSAPKYKVDATEIMKKEGQKVIEKEAKKFLKKFF